MSEPLEPENSPEIEASIQPHELFDLRMRVLTIEQLAWKAYVAGFTNAILENVGLPQHIDPKSEMAAEAARCADALMRERRKRFPLPDSVQQVLVTNH